MTERSLKLERPYLAPEVKQSSFGYFMAEGYNKKSKYFRNGDFKLPTEINFPDYSNNPAFNLDSINHAFNILGLYIQSPAIVDEVKDHNVRRNFRSSLPTDVYYAGSLNRLRGNMICGSLLNLWIIADCLQDNDSRKEALNKIYTDYSKLAEAVSNALYKVSLKEVDTLSESYLQVINMFSSRKGN